MIVLTLSRLAPQFQMESMAEEIKQLTEVSRAAVDTVNSMKAKTETVEADLKTLAHNIQGFTEEDLDDGDDDDNLHHQHAAPSSHHRRSSQVRHRSDDSSSAASVDRHAHEHDFGVFIGKLPAAAATDGGANGDRGIGSCPESAVDGRLLRSRGGAPLPRVRRAPAGT